MAIETATEAWELALGTLADLGTTDQALGAAQRPDSELWFRVARAYNREVRHQADPAAVMPEELVDGQLDGQMAEVRRAYNERPGHRMISMERVAALLKARGHERAYVEQTGGGCATLYAGKPWRDEQGDDREAAVGGPGSFYGLDGWTEPYATSDEFWVGRDDDATTQQYKVPSGATEEDIAEVMHLQIVASEAMSAVRAGVQRARAAMSGRVVWGDRLTAGQCEALRDLEAGEVGGDADWRIAVYLYELADAVDLYGVHIPSGRYLRTVEGKREQAFAVTGDPAFYVRAIEDDYNDEKDGYLNRRALDSLMNRS